MEEETSKERMASESNARTRGIRDGEESISEGRPPILPPISTGGALDLDELSEIDPARTPTSELSSLPSSIHTPAASWTSEDLISLPSQDPRLGDPLIQRRGDYFPPVLHNRNVAEVSRETSTSSLSSASDESLVHRRRDSTSAQQSPERRPPVLRDLSTRTVIQDTSKDTPLPAVPIQRYPIYPNQSFAALHSQQYPPPYPLRTRNSHPSQTLAHPVSAPRSRAYSAMPSGAKSVGNTPAQSPSLFIPSTPQNKRHGEDFEENAYSTPKLHPTQLQKPKETHKLVKDHDPVSGRKVVNNYEFLEKLGSGQHGTVKLGRETKGLTLVAIKIVRRFSKKLRLGKLGDPNDMIKKEVAILKKARHPHVVSLLEVIDDDEFGKVYLVLEFVERGEIVWRKKTDKDIAIFEMNRIRREQLQQIDERYEYEEREKFNAAAPWRRQEKARILDEQKCQAWNIIKARAEQKRRYHSVESSFWSLEYAADLEEEQVSEASPENITPPPETCSPADFDTPRPPSVAHSKMARTFDQRSDKIAFESTLDQIIAAQCSWTVEEEEFMQVPCLTISQALDAFRDTVLGLEYLHYQGIIHRDIKPANLLWTSDRRVKISDFGVSYLGKPIREDDNNEEIAEADADDLDEAIELAKTVGTPAFYAPELCDPELFDVSKNPDRPLITGQIDVWALGATLYAMIFGRLPFFDVNEFAMYEKIARQEVFIPRLRLKGVENRQADSAMECRTKRILRNFEELENPTRQESQEEEIAYDESRDPNKRPDDILEYEAVDEELRDLLRRLLDKQPLKRISLKDVKRHPWVLRGITDESAWVDETDPSVQSQGRKIEVSTEEVQEAVIGATFVDRVTEKLNATLRRLGSVVRGRSDGRKRRHSNANSAEKIVSTSSSKGSVSSQEGRRSSLRGDERYFTSWASREGSEHPLSQSVAASPEMKPGQSYFDGDNSGLITPNPHDSNDRPTFLERTLSNADSTRTIRPAVPTMRAVPNMNQEIASSSAEMTFSTMTPVTDSNSASTLGSIIRSAKGFMGKREWGRSGESASQSSRSSSVENISRANEEAHASASLAISSAMAVGHFDQPAVHRDFPLPDLSWESDPGQNRTYSHASPHRCGSTSSAADVGPSSPDREPYPRETRSSSSYSDGAPPFNISSSSDQIASGMSESASHPSFPSIISGASSLSANTGENSSLLKEFSHPSTSIPRSLSSVLAAAEMSNRSSALKANAEDEIRRDDDDEAGYNAEHESDSDSDEGIEMSRWRPK